MIIKEVRSQESEFRINNATRYAGGFFNFFLLTRGAKAMTDEAGAALPNTRGPIGPTDEPREAMVNTFIFWLLAPEF